MGTPGDHTKQTVPALRIAVTGSQGFVGRHLVPHLREHGHTVVPITRSASTANDLCSVGDYADASALTRLFIGVDVVVHLAGRAHQRRDVQDETRAFYQANVAGTAGVIQACLSAGVRRLVYVSSIGVHGNRSDSHAITESDPLLPVEPYAVSKLDAENTVRSRLAAGSTDFVILRPPLVYGPGCPGNFAQLLKFAARAPVVPLGGLRAPRRLIGVHNLVDALRVAAFHPMVSRKTFVLGDSRDVTVSEIARVAATAMGRPETAVWNVPPLLMRLLAGAAGKGSTFEKLAAPLQVDPAAFCTATGWSAPVAPQVGLAEAAAACRTT